jgi:hypothetical protein
MIIAFCGCGIFDLGLIFTTYRQDGSTSLTKASEKGHAEIVNLLVNAGADTKMLDKVSRDSSCATCW